MKRKEYTGDEITVSFDLSRCIHARNCFTKLPDVFDPGQRPWVQVDKAPAEEVASVVRSCPSGALAFSKPGGAQETPPKLNRVSIMENGPLAVTGEVEVDGNPNETRVTLCRCGLSKNKPYCDYSHVEAGFEATGEPKPTLPAASDEKGGALSVTRTSNGPLKVEGNFDLSTGTGRQLTTGAKAFLCRCGASKNKPYCDGSHKAAGFVDTVGD